SAESVSQIQPANERWQYREQASWNNILLGSREAIDPAWWLSGAMQQPALQAYTPFTVPSAPSYSPQWNPIQQPKQKQGGSFCNSLPPPCNWMTPFGGW
ncbi:MAG: hypothetical protein HN382_02270, partial [Gammaproteobacteria bacterium]|nr:hypothetical protein [Gammaproteobacteria bacterium]